MKKLFLFFTGSFFLLSIAKGQTSTITGSIIVNFNYTRNDPDVGAEIKLFDINKKYSYNVFGEDSIKKTTADIDGKYILKNVPAGEYILFISSKGALTEPFYLYNDIKSPGSLSEKLKAISGFDFSKHREDLQAEIQPLFEESIKLATDKKFKKYEKLNNEMNKKIKEYFDSLPSEIKSFFDTYAGGKIPKEFKEITIKPGIDENYTTTFKVRY